MPASGCGKLLSTLCTEVAVDLKSAERRLVGDESSTGTVNALVAKLTEIAA
jgi:hypothetical protein